MANSQSNPRSPEAGSKLARLSLVDKLIIEFDRAVRSVSPGSTSATRKSPAAGAGNVSNENKIDDLPENLRHIGGLMRINHTGEVCAQALYQGQALTAKDRQTREAMQASAIEEEDHLAWCEERLAQLGSHTSYLNPLFYGLSFGIGAAAGLIGDKWSLGFIAATEDQVCKHLQDHLQQIPESDTQSRAILEQMLIDERHHGNKALAAGGAHFSDAQKQLMTAFSKLMTYTTYKV